MVPGTQRGRPYIKNCSPGVCARYICGLWLRSFESKCSGAAYRLVGRRHTLHLSVHSHFSIAFINGISLALGLRKNTLPDPISTLGKLSFEHYKFYLEGRMKPLSKGLNLALSSALPWIIFTLLLCALDPVESLKKKNTSL